jgi:hypothetical protein
LRIFQARSLPAFENVNEKPTLALPLSVSLLVTTNERDKRVDRNKNRIPMEDLWQDVQDILTGRRSVFRVLLPWRVRDAAEILLSRSVVANALVNILPFMWSSGRFRGSVAEAALQLLIREHDWPGSPARGRAEDCFIIGDVHLNLACLAYRLRGNGWENSIRQHFLDAENRSLFFANVPAAAQREWTKCGILYSSPLNPKHNLETAFMFFLQAHNNGCMHATYWLGRAYLNGFGVDCDAKLGATLTLEAASSLDPVVLRAKFEVATLYEKGCDPVIQKNHVLAVEYYQGVILAATNPPQPLASEWIWDFAKSHMKNNEDFHAVDTSLDSQTGNVLSWELAGQAFLFGAFAALATGNSCENCGRVYTLLFVFVPLIGMYVAFLSISASSATATQNSLQRNKLLELYDAKREACRKLAGPFAGPSGPEDLGLHAMQAFQVEYLATILHILLFIIWAVLLASYLVRQDPGITVLHDMTTSVNGTTRDAARPYGLPLCLDEYSDESCSIGCPSLFYTVNGTGENMTASTCDGTDWNARLIVREGPMTSACPDLICLRTFRRLPRIVS